MGIMLSVTVVKLFLVIYCRSFTNEIVKAYAQDHFFDVITNIIGLIAALLANYVSDWMDPVGAIIVSECVPYFFQFSLWCLQHKYDQAGFMGSDGFIAYHFRVLCMIVFVYVYC